MRQVIRSFALFTIVILAYAGGSASTASNTFAPNATTPIVGYAETSVSGATVNTLAYNLSMDGSQINSVRLVLEGNTTLLSKASMNFNGGTAFSCGSGSASTTLPVVTTYTCTPPAPIQTNTLTTTAVIVN